MLQPLSNFISGNESTLQSRKSHEAFSCDNEYSMYLIKKQTIEMNKLNYKEIRIQLKKVTTCSDNSNSVNI